MQAVRLEETLPYPAKRVWEIIADVTRADWVPMVDEIVENDGVRSFTMVGVGEVEERILKLDSDEYCLRYTAIKTPTALEHHLATIELCPLEDACRFTWSTEIAPDRFADAIEQAMKASLAELKGVLVDS